MRRNLPSNANIPLELVGVPLASSSLLREKVVGSLGGEPLSTSVGTLVVEIASLVGEKVGEKVGSWSVAEQVSRMPEHPNG